MIIISGRSSGDANLSENGKKTDLFVFQFLFRKVSSLAGGFFSPQSNFLFC